MPVLRVQSASLSRKNHSPGRASRARNTDRQSSVLLEPRTDGVVGAEEYSTRSQSTADTLAQEQLIVLPAQARHHQPKNMHQRAAHNQHPRSKVIEKLAKNYAPGEHGECL